MQTKIKSVIAFFSILFGLLAWAPVYAQQLQSDASEFPYWIEMMQDQSANFYETQSAFNAYWEGREITKGSGYKPFKRWEYWMEQRVSPDGTRPAPDRDIRAYNEYISANSNRSSAGNWTPLGPFTVPSGYNGYRGLGRVNAIAFHPTDPNVVYIGAPSGGFWKTIDGGQNWTTHTDILPTLGVSAIVVDHVNPNVIYMGTGDRDAGDAPGLGVWKSIDGGATWSVSNSGMGNVTVGRLLMHPDDNTIIFAATSGGFYKSVDSGNSWYRTASGNFKEAVFKPGNPEIIYGAVGGVFYRSQNNGENFTVINNGLPGGARGVIAVTPADPEIVYFLLTNSQSYKGIYLSTDSGLSFSVRSTTPNIMSWDCTGGSGGQAWYDLDVAVDPNNQNIVFAGGVNIFKSTNGGTNWNITAHWYGGCGVQSVHADLHVLEYNPLNNRLYAGNDGGVYWTANGGQSWTEISNGLVISQAYKIGQSATNKDYVINGYQDNGTSTYTGNSWVSVGGGDGMECAFDPGDHRYSYSTVYYGSINRIYNNNSQGQIAGEGSNGITEGGAWVTPFLIDQFDGNIMFIGYKNVWRSTNIKANNTNSVSWTKISSFGSGNLSVMDQSRVNTNIMYVSGGNQLYRSDNVKDGSVQWISLSSFLLTGNTITSIETSPVDENTVYIAQQNRIFKSTDKGFNWVEITGSLPDVQLNSIVYYRNSQEGLYLGTDIGIFYRDANMSDWILFSNGFPAAGRVTELEIYYDPAGPEGDVIRAGTYGRGLWESPVNYSAPTADFSASETTLTIGCAVNFTDLSTGVPFDWLWTFEGADTEISTERNPTGITWSAPGDYNVTLAVSNPAGNDTVVKTSYIFVSEDLLPVVSFTADKRAFCSNENPVVHFSDDSENCPTSWEWSFNPTDVTFINGTSASSQNPEVVFNVASNYDVTLTVYNVNGQTILTIEDYVQIGGLAIPFGETWESQSVQMNSWTIENPDNKNTWELAQVNGNSGGTTAIMMNFFGYSAAPGPRDRLVSPPFNFSGVEAVFLGFDHAYARRYEQITDSLIILISPDCGQTWERIFAIGENGSGNFATHTVVDTGLFVPALTEDWCGSPGNPVCNLIDLSQYANAENIRIAFESVHRRGNSLYLDNIFLTNLVSTINLETSSPKIKLFPNPGRDVLNIQSNEELRNARVSIVNVSGISVYDKKLENGKNWSLSTSNLKKGIYFLRIESQGINVTEKLIIE
ncbi:MAG: T9SS type A sorting domain-containing protein [Lentimicrobium sp.]|nr:T9SS type A sorting domain-containing protein [Lentimicrobium sp.]